MRPSGLDVEPSPVHAPRGSTLPLAIALALGAFVVLAVLKPWASAPAAPVPAQGRRSPELRSVPPSPTGSLVADAAPPVTDPGVADGATVDPTALAYARQEHNAIRQGTGWDPVSSMVRELARNGGTWGAGTGSWTGAGGDWTDWTQLPAGRGRAPSPAVPDAASVCRAGSLRTSPKVLAITGPAAAVDAAGVSVWRLRREPYLVSESFEIDRLESAPGIAFLVLDSGAPWPDGAYRLIVQATGQPAVGLDVCVGTLRHIRPPAG
jgi:hypothetical protein